MIDRLSYEDGDLYWLDGKNKGKKAGHTNKDGYIHIKLDGRTHKAHRLIWSMFHTTTPEFIDHIDGDKGNNRIQNLRPASKVENGSNIRSQNRRNTSGFFGVSRDKSGGWRAQLKFAGSKLNLGTYESAEIAAKVYDICCKELRGEFAVLNFPEVVHERKPD